MNTQRLKRFLVSSGRRKSAYAATVLLGVMLISLSPVCAKEITYQGEDLSDLQTKAFFAGNKRPVRMLVPMDENKQPVASGNMLTIDYVPAGRQNELMIVSGGSAEKGEVLNNTVLLKNGKIKGFLYGGTGKDVAASGNIIHISGGETLQLIYGGAARNGAADSNEVHISGGVIKRTVFGGWIQEEGSANNNKIEITGGIFPGNSNAEGASVKSAEGEAHGNSVLITGSAKFEGPFSVFGGRSKKLSSHNQSVLIGTPELATAERFVVVGGINDLNGSIIPEANENEAIIKGGYVTIERAYGGKSNGGNTLRNKLTFDGRGPEGKNASVEKILAGGHAKYVASYNDVTVIGGRIGERIAGGEVGENAGDLNYTAHYNTVNLHDAITFGGGEAPFFLLGGCQYNAQDERALPVARPQLFTGNRLNLASDFSMSGKIDKLANFEFIDFKLPADTKDTLANQPQKSILSVEDADLTDGESGKARNTKVQVLGIAQGGHALTRGDKVLLIKADKSLTYNSDDHEQTTIANEADGVNGYLTQGLFLHRSEIVIDKDRRTVALDIVDSTTPPLTTANLAPMAVISDLDPLVFLDDVPEK
ncbi:MAG: hypothetical protein ACOYD9_03235 [Pyramidobacter sp.]|jgi:hypothetical protein